MISPSADQIQFSIGKLGGNQKLVKVVWRIVLTDVSYGDVPG
jgi:hypothetical protein